MPKNVVIMEGGKGLRFTDVSKLITDKSNGNDSWVPTEDRIIRQKYISKNGIYYAKDDGIYGFSKLTVNIPGGAQGYTVPTVASLPYGVEVATTDPSQPMPIIPGTVGSSVMGVDPDTGYVSTATVNPNGEVEIKAIPQAIAITKMPNKLKYNDGDKIDYTGIEVSLYVKYEETSSGGSIHVDAVPFRDERYPEGKIPFSELIFPVSEADGKQKDAYTDLNGIVAKAFHCTKRVDFSYTSGYASNVFFRSRYAPVMVGGEPITTYDFVVIPKVADVYMTEYNGVIYAAYVGENPIISWNVVSCKQYNSMTPDGDSWRAHNPFSMGDNKFKSATMVQNTETLNGIPTSSVDPTDFPTGDMTPKSDIPVQWTSPYDGKTYETSFTIDVVKKNEESEGGSSEGGSSEGGGGGHSF